MKEQFNALEIERTLGNLIAFGEATVRITKSDRTRAECFWASIRQSFCLNWVPGCGSGQAISTAARAFRGCAFDLDGYGILSSLTDDAERTRPARSIIGRPAVAQTFLSANSDNQPVLPTCQRRVRSVTVSPRSYRHSQAALLFRQPSVRWRLVADGSFSRSRAWLRR
jgi:hypothetical protein